jgi:uncharacterized protein (TIGR03437 family)
VLAINQDGSINDADHPAAASSFIKLYATGEGQTIAGAERRTRAVPLPLPVLPVTATIGGRTATVQYAGARQGLSPGSCR